MKKIKLRVSGSQIQAVEQPAVITAGTVGLTVEFAFDSQWDSLTKTAVFRAGDQVIATVLEQDTHQIPWEVLEKPNLWLSIGVHGANEAGTVVIPTVWAQVAVVHTGVDPDGDPAMDPTIPAWQEALTRLDNITPEIRDHIINAGGDNPHGVTCEQIGAVAVEAYEIFRSDTTDQLTAFDEFLSTQIEETNYLYDDFSAHKKDKNNPHGVTCDQIGAVPEDVYAEHQFSLISNIDDANGKINVHLVDENNPHYVTCEQIGAAAKEDVEATKALIVTVSGTTPSHTSQEIFNAVLSGRAVYLKMWSGTYMALSWTTADEAIFEASVLNTITGADGETYGVQNFRLYRVVGDKLNTNSAKVPEQAYVDAQIQYYLNQ